ncbi:MAG: AAA family ATPase [Bdellovibrionota bacterium]
MSKLGRNDDISPDHLTMKPYRLFVNELPDELGPLVEGLLDLGTLSLLVARPKVGKSLLSRTLVASIITGEPFLGKSVVSGRVLYAPLEEHPIKVASHLRSLGVSDQEENLAILTGKAVSTSAAMSELETAIAHYKPALVVIDTLGRFCGIRDVNDYSQTTDAFSPLIAIAQSYNCHILIVHHLSKGSSSSDGILGSTGIFGSVDSVIKLNKPPGNFVQMSTTQRYRESEEGIALALDPDTLRFTRSQGDLPLSSTKLIAEVKLELAKYPGGIDREALLEKVGGRRNYVVDALKILLERDEILKTGAGIRGDPSVYKLRDSESVPTL